MGVIQIRRGGFSIFCPPRIRLISSVLFRRRGELGVINLDNTLTAHHASLQTGRLYLDANPNSI